jgi:hypothetical protein
MASYNGNHDAVLGTRLIESAVDMEDALAGVLAQEAEKFRRFNAANPNIDQILEFDGQLVAILQAVCCIEETVATKVLAGLILRGNDTP